MLQSEKMTSGIHVASKVSPSHATSGRRNFKSTMCQIRGGRIASEDHAVQA